MPNETLDVLTFLFGDKQAEEVMANPALRHLIVPVAHSKGQDYKAVKEIYLAVVRSEALEITDPARCERISKTYARQAQHYREGALGCTVENIAYSEATAQAYSERAKSLRAAGVLRGEEER
jgi:hypothetical protein